MADIQRNEVSIELAGETRVMRATFGAIRAIERDLGNVLTLIDKITRGDIGVDQSARVIFHGLHGYDDKRLSLDEVGEAVVQAGLGQVMKPVIDFLTKAMEGVSPGKPVAAQP